MDADRTNRKRRPAAWWLASKMRKKAAGTESNAVHLCEPLGDTDKAGRLRALSELEKERAKDDADGAAE
jgi:hypothetical protein